jgi:outer membrane protein
MGVVQMLCAAAAALAVVAALVQPASALSLDEALGAAYEYNPRLDAERARLRATDEGVAIAKSGYRPDIRASADTSSVYTDIRDGASGKSRPRGYGVDLVQPIFRGFSVTNAVNEAESNVRAGREALRRVEQEVLAEAVRTFMEVVRDQAIVRLNENNVKVLSEELKATQDRFSVGEVTRTDVAQSEARRARALAELDLARGNYQTSRGNFERTVGQPAVGLVEPSLKLSLLPNSLDEAIAIATQENPNIVEALYREQAARFQVDTIRGQLLPQVTLEASYDDRYDSGDFGPSSRVETGSVTGRVTVPLYEAGGRVHAEVRQSKQIHLATLQDIEEARVQVKAFAIEAWARFVSARAALESAKAQVEANQIALNGVREEERVGQRTLIEVLNAQQELLDSQVELVSQKTNVIIAAYALQAALGRLDAMSLGVTSLVYDPEQHYTDVRRKWWGISITHEDGRREHLDLWPGREQMK